MAEILAENVIHDEKCDGVTGNVRKADTKITKQRPGKIRVLIGIIDPSIAERDEDCGAGQHWPKKGPPYPQAMIQIRLNVGGPVGLGCSRPRLRIIE
jgi:hypothetical protein